MPVGAGEPREARRLLGREDRVGPGPGALGCVPLPSFPAPTSFPGWQSRLNPGLLMSPPRPALSPSLGSTL